MTTTTSSEAAPFRLNDLRLTQAILALSLEASKIDKLIRDNDKVGLWKSLGIIMNKAEVAQYRVLHLNAEESKHAPSQR